jgi:hypothetical protein
MSKKVDESYNYDKEAREGEDIRKCLPRRVPLVNPNEEWTHHKPKKPISSGSNHDPHQKHEVSAIEKAIPLDKMEEIKGGPDGHVLASNLFRTSCGRATRTATLICVALWVAHPCYQH